MNVFSSVLQIFTHHCLIVLATQAIDDDAHPSQSFTTSALKSYMANLMHHNVSARDCPAPKFPHTEKDCKLRTCTNDSQCSNKEVERCCFNGCVFTCLPKVAPPPVIDWEQEPVFKSSNGDEQLWTEAMRCSASPRPAPSEPIGCPTGYTCHVARDDMSFGVCVRDLDSDRGSNFRRDDSTFQEKTSKEIVYLPGGCVLSSKQYGHMQDFMRRDYVVDCFCVDGSVECKVSL